MKYTTSRILVFLSVFAIPACLMAGPPSAADVGDAESFGHGALYMGATSGFITLAPSCTPAPAPVPPFTVNNSQCFNITPGSAVPATFDAQDICRINLPKKATRTIIYPALNFFIHYQLNNTTGTFQPQGLFAFNANVSIESDALLDPSIIDPSTGLPANGKLVSQFSYAYRDDRSMENNARQRQRMTLVRVGNTGITKAQLVGLGLSQAVVDNLFNSAMTIRMSVQGNTRLLDDASITANMRLFGD
jgi:hypothetical protein